MDDIKVIFDIKCLLHELASSEFERGLAAWRGNEVFAQELKMKSVRLKSEIIQLVEKLIKQLR